MATTNPLTMARNRMQNFQQWTFESNYQGISKSCAVSWINSISAEAKKGDWTSNIVARIYVIGLPIVCGCSLIQLSCVTLADLTTKAMGFSRKEVVVIKPADPEKPYTTEQEIAVSEDVFQLIKHVVGTASLIFYWFVGVLITPTVFIRKELSALPDSQVDVEKDKAAQEKQQAVDAAKREGAEGIAKAKEENAEELQRLRASVQTLTTQQNTANEAALLSILGTITAATFSQLVSHLERIRYPHIQLRSYQDEKTFVQTSWGSPADMHFNQPKLKEGFFRDKGGKIYQESREMDHTILVLPKGKTEEKDRLRCKPVKIQDEHLGAQTSGELILPQNQVFENSGTPFTRESSTPKSKETFLTPYGTRELTLVCGNFEPAKQQELLSAPHDIHRLVLVDPNIEMLKSLATDGVLSKIDTLVIKSASKMEVYEGDLLDIANRFKNIAAFDLRECKVVKDDSETTVNSQCKELSKDHIVIYTNYAGRSDGGVRFEGEGVLTDNIELKLEELNRKLHSIMSYKYHRDDITSLYLEFPDDRLFHCAAPFVTELNFLRGADLQPLNLERLMPRLAKSFRHVQTLDMSYCRLLTFDGLIHLTKLPMKKLFLDGCESIFFQRINRDEHDRKVASHPDVFYNQHLERHYRLKAEAVAYRFIDFVRSGVKVRALKIEAIRLGNTQIEDSKTFFAMLKEVFEKTVYTEMKSWYEANTENTSQVGFGVKDGETSAKKFPE